MGGRAGDGGRARGELTLEQSKVRLEPLYTVTFRTPEAWSVKVAAEAGIDCEGPRRISPGSFHASEFPRRVLLGSSVNKDNGIP